MLKVKEMTARNKSRVQLTGTAVAVAVDADGPLAGVILEGAPGVGKTRLALLVSQQCPWRRTCLISDDVVFAATQGARLLLSGAPATAGLMELRGFGVVNTRHVWGAPLRALFTLGSRAPRLPDRQYRAIAGYQTPVFHLAGCDAFDAAKIRTIVRSIIAGQTP